MKVLSFALFLAQADLLTFRAFACRGHHQHHHADSHHRDLLEEDNDADFDFLPCGMGATSDEQRLEESKAMSSWKAKHANRNLGETDITIPVYFHVIRDDQGNGDVPDGMVYAYLQSLNDEFAGTAFSFRMISINRINNSEWHACTFSNNREAKTVHNVPGKQNMNVYFCDIQNGSGGWACKLRPRLTWFLLYFISTHFPFVQTCDIRHAVQCGKRTVRWDCTWKQLPKIGLPKRLRSSLRATTWSRPLVSKFVSVRHFWCKLSFYALTHTLLVSNQNKGLVSITRIKTDVMPSIPPMDPGMQIFLTSTGTEF